MSENINMVDALHKTIYNQDQKIAELEAKLAKSKKKIKGFVELFDKKQHENYEQFCEIMQLKQQFAESKEQLNNSEQKCLICHKDQENEQLKKEIEYLQKQCEINQDVIDLMRQNTEKDKISFAVEQFEKVKEYAKNIEEHIYNMYDNTNIVSDYHYAKLTVISNIFKFIDNQIKQLKEVV